MPARRDYSHMDWGAIRDLLKNGVTLREVSKQFDVPYATLANKSHRERWNIMAMHAGLPRRSRKELEELKRTRHETYCDLPAIASEIKSNFAFALLKVSRFYKDADVKTLRKDSRSVLQHVYAATKLLSLNDGKHSEVAPALNLTLLATRPTELVVSAAREIQTVVQPVSPESQSGGPRGDPPASG